MQAVEAMDQHAEDTHAQQKHAECGDLIALLERQAARYGDRPVYSYLDRQLRLTASISFAELYDQAIALAAALQALGLSGKTVVMLYLPGKDFPVAFWAAILAGVCPVPVTRPRGRDWSVIERIITRAGAAAILGSAALLKLLPGSVLSGTAVLAHEELSRQPADNLPASHALSESYNLAWRRPTVDGSAPALLQFTSGSTGYPKGVILTHGNILHNLARISRFFACDDRDIGLCWLPLHHDMGLIGHIMQPVFSGIHNYFMAPVHFLGRPLRWLEAINQVRATISGAPCFAYSFCVEALKATPRPRLDLSCWRVAYCGAEKISAAVLRDFHKQLQPQGMQASALFPCYGLAESTLFVTGRHSLKVAMGSHAANSKGQAPLLVSVGPVDDCIRIVNVRTGGLCGEFEAGEIWLASSSVATGYYNDGDASGASFNQSLAGTEERLLRTGDLGMVADNELYLLGRTKNVFKLRGSPVHAEDIEQLVMDESRDRGVARCAVIGTDQHQTEGIAVLVELTRTTDPSKTQQLRHDIWQLIAERAGVVPHSLTILAAGALPLTTSGKVQRFACQCLTKGEQNANTK